MDILHLTPEAHELLQNWGEENRLLVDSVLPYSQLPQTDRKTVSLGL